MLLVLLSCVIIDCVATNPPWNPTHIHVATCWPKSIINSRMRYFGGKTTTLSNQKCANWKDVCTHRAAIVLGNICRVFSADDLEKLECDLNKLELPEEDDEPKCLVKKNGKFSFEYCFLPCSGNPTRAASPKVGPICYPVDGVGLEYKGDMAETLNGEKCKDRDFCRNGDNWKYGPWCSFPKDGSSWYGNCFQRCFVDFANQEETFHIQGRTNDGRNYRAWCTNDTGVEKELRTVKPEPEPYTSYSGTKAKTKSGLDCIRWSQAPNYQELGENYCRNPDSYEKGPWCYWSDSSTTWEACFDMCLAADWMKSEERPNTLIRKVPGSHSLTDCVDPLEKYNGSKQVTVSGEPCLDNSVCSKEDSDAYGPACNISENRREPCFPICKEHLLFTEPLCRNAEETMVWYVGEKNTTIYGHVCAPWETGKGEHDLANNYCRNPNPISRELRTFGPHCRVKDGETYTEYPCFAECGDLYANCYAPDKSLVYTGEKKVTASGIPCADVCRNTHLEGTAVHPGFGIPYCTVDYKEYKKSKAPVLLPTVQAPGEEPQYYETCFKRCDGSESDIPYPAWMDHSGYRLPLGTHHPSEPLAEDDFADDEDREPVPLSNEDALHEFLKKVDKFATIFVIVVAISSCGFICCAECCVFFVDFIRMKIHLMRGRDPLYFLVVRQCKRRGLPVPSYEEYSELYRRTEETPSDEEEEEEAKEKKD